MPSARDYMPEEIGPRAAELWAGMAQGFADKVAINIDRANITPVPTSAAWSYKVPFRLIGSVSGEVIPYTGTVAASASDTSTAGTASVPAATVDVVMGHGVATLNGDAQAWLNTETATLLLTYSLVRGSGTVTDSFVVTFTA